MNRFTSKNDIRQYVSEGMPLDIEQYGMSYDDLLDHATDNFSNYLNEQGFCYGMELQPEWLEELDYADFSLWWSFFESEVVE